MPYLILFLNRFWWMLQSIVMFHLEMLATYFQGLAVWIEGDRVVEVYIEQASYTSYKKMKMEEHIATDEDVVFQDGEEDG